MARDNRDATLVVIEFGASWPRWLRPSSQLVGDMAVVAQHYEGHPSSLVTQVGSRVARLQGAGWRTARVVFVANSRVDDDARAARSVIGRGLLARLEATGFGQLVLTVDHHAGLRSKRQLAALAESLGRDTTSAYVSVTTFMGRLAFEHSAGRELAHAG